MKSGGVTVLALSLLTLLAGCEKHMKDMYDQPRYKPLASSPIFDDGGASRGGVEGTQVHARGDFAGTSSGRVGTQAALTWSRDQQAQSSPYPDTLPWLQHGRERYEIYCSPCHSLTGDGDGLVVRKGFPAPPSLHDERMRNMDDRGLFNVISDGYGIMYPFAGRISPADRWAIVAYIRALQRSQAMPLQQLNDADRAQLRRASP